MSVPTTFNRVQYVANGTTTDFSFNAIVYFATEIVVEDSNGVIYVLNTDYTIDPSDLGQQGGITVVFGTAPIDGLMLTIARVVPFVQNLQLPQNTGLPSKNVERNFDELVFQIQQMNDQLSRTPSLPITTPIGQIVSPIMTAYVPYDTSTGTTARVTLTAGNHKDNSAGVAWPFSVTNLVVGADDVVFYWILAIDENTGFITGISAATGIEIPDDDSTHCYQLISDMTVSISTIAKVTLTGGGGAGKVWNYFYCGVLPAIDGSGHLLNS